MSGNARITTPRALPPELVAERTADRQSLLFLVALIVLSLIVEATSLQIEAARAGGGLRWWEPWLVEGTSHAAVFVLFPFFTVVLTRAPLSASTWRWAMPLHVAALVCFTVAHVLLFVALRMIGFLVIADEPYAFSLTDPMAWLYELRKDAFTYVLIQLLIGLNRAAHYRELERDAARADARASGRVTLKCGGRMLSIDAGGIHYAKAAGNYVEVHTREKAHLARTTLAALEELLADAGSRSVRVHRSYAVNLDHVREVVPTGTGDARIHLANGTIIPGSRRYRAALSEALAGREP